jgi:hypothetical protein
LIPAGLEVLLQRNKLKPKKEVKTARVPMIPEADFPMLFPKKTLNRNPIKELIIKVKLNLYSL